MNFPQNLKYTNEHEWIRVEGDVAYVGITDYAQGELGEIVYVDITTEGETVAQEEVFGTIEAVKTVSDLFMPVSGEVLEVNAELEDAPELVNEDAYGKGWLIKISLTDASELEELLSAEDYQKLISETIDSIKKTVDEFDVDDFKDSSLAKLNELKDKFDDVVTKLQDSDQYSKLKDQVDNVIVQVNDKINEVKEKMSEQEFDDFSDLEDEINDIEDDLNVIIDDLKD